ncbi:MULTISPECIES: nucleotidyltransferase domain-containing protein [Archaeoglobus]|uniref:nucleotidyltransferase domain-containing protein n=1 Tax=Archaeoglobus sp. TaxID=1872626 RepID=UPI0009D6EFC7|nr:MULTISPECIES: nucleotidyltransferase domain-containing protein [Archaeoglobus]
MVKAAREVLGEAEVYLFGSVAEGKAVLSSDIDILVVTTREEVRKARERARIIAEIEERAGLPFVHPFEFHIMDEEEFRVWLEVFRPKIVRIL